MHFFYRKSNHDFAHEPEAEQSYDMRYCGLIRRLIFIKKKQNIFYEIWSISSSPSVEWSPATTGRVDADILN